MKGGRGLSGLSVPKLSGQPCPVYIASIKLKPIIRVSDGSEKAREPGVTASMVLQNRFLEMSNWAIFRSNGQLQERESEKFTSYSAILMPVNCQSFAAFFLLLYPWKFILLLLIVKTLMYQ